VTSILLPQAHLGHQQVGRVGRAADLAAVRRALDQQAAAQLEGGLDAGRRGSADAWLLLQFGQAGPGQALEAVKGRQEVGCVLKLVGCAEEDGQQIAVAEGRGP